MDIRKTENVKISSQRNLILSKTNVKTLIFHQIVNLELLPMQLPQDKRCLIISHKCKIFVLNINRDNGLKALLTLHNILFARFTKTKDFGGLKFSKCLNQFAVWRNKALISGLIFRFKWRFLVTYCTTDTAASDTPYIFICACAFAKFAK